MKKLYEGNATGKIPDRHFTRLLAEYDEEQTGLETSIAEWQRQIGNWNADRLKTDQFIPIYPHTGEYAREHGELDAFLASLETNVACRDAIETAIREGFDGMSLHADTKGVLAVFGAERVSHVQQPFSISAGP